MKYSKIKIRFGILIFKGNSSLYLNHVYVFIFLGVKNLKNFVMGMGGRGGREDGKGIFLYLMRGLGMKYSLGLVRGMEFGSGDWN